MLLNKIFMFICVVLLLISCVVEKQHTIEFRLAYDEPGEGLTEYVFDKTGDVFYVEKGAHISNDNIVHASSIELSHGYGVQIKFNDVGTEKFRELTGNNIGKRIAMILDDELVSAPIVRDTITQGVAIIMGMFTADEAEDIAKGLKP